MPSIHENNTFVEVVNDLIVFFWLQAKKDKLNLAQIELATGYWKDSLLLELH
jgi:hypothetical protein